MEVMVADYFHWNTYYTQPVLGRSVGDRSGFYDDDDDDKYSRATSRQSASRQRMYGSYNSFTRDKMIPKATVSSSDSSFRLERPWPMRSFILLNVALVLTFAGGVCGELVGLPSNLILPTPSYSELPRAMEAQNVAYKGRMLTDESTMFDCDFDTGTGDACNWNLAIGGVATDGSSTIQPFLLNTGQTPSGDARSGPSTDKSGTGYYVYTESDKNNNAEFAMQLNLGHTFSAHGISFYYYLQGNSIGTMDFQVSSDGTTFTTCWTHSGQTTVANWIYKVISLSSAGTCAATDLSSALYFRFYYQNGGNPHAGDAALDTFAVVSNPTLHPTQQPLPYPTGQPTLPPTSSPTKSPTTLPSYVPSPHPTAQPTVVPSPMPLPVPTEQPTIVPTPKPTLTYKPSTGTPAPFPKPSPQPTSLPTLPPTMLPTHSHPPTILPTPSPTHIPTPAPTVVCGNGTYFEPPSTCTPCGVGYYLSDKDFVNGRLEAPWPTSCKLCPGGQYNVALGQSSCTECVGGKLSNAERSGCEDCEAGQYTSNFACNDCEWGKYAPTAQKDSCLTCFAGDYVNRKLKSTSCLPCDAGSFSTDLSRNCTLCPVGTLSASRASACTNCAGGKFSNVIGASSCSECAAGYYQPLEAQTSCMRCPVGKYRAGTGQKSCLNCAKGKYTGATGSYGCETCAGGLTSVEGARSCLRAAKLYYLPNNVVALQQAGEKTLRNGTVSEACPDNAVCLGGLDAPRPSAGFWSDRREYSDTFTIYQCSRETCKGALVTNSSGNQSCWHQAAFVKGSLSGEDDDSGCNDQGHLLCTTGANGYLCGSCEVGYIYSGASRRCSSCEGKSNTTFYILVALIVLGGIGSVVGEMIGENLIKLDPGSVKVTWNTYQIIAATSVNLDITYPDPFGKILAYMSFFSLDFLSIECFADADAEQRYYQTVMFYSIVPLFGALAIVVACGFRLLLAAVLNPDAGVKLTNDIKSQHLWSFLFLTYIVLPPVAMKQLQSLDCRVFPHDGSRLLRADTSVDCDSDSYQSFKQTTLIFVAIYQLIPMIWLYLLWLRRDQLNPKVSKMDPSLGLYIREKDVSLRSLEFLFDSYRCDNWWFEVVEMYRRMVFVSAVPLVSPSPAKRASLGCVLAIVSLVFYREYSPFNTKFTNLIAYMAQLVIFLSFYAALSIETGQMIDFGLDDFGMGLFLLGMCCSILILTLGLGFVSLQADRQERATLLARAMALESGGEFTDSHLSSTFETVNNSAVPPTHVLVFYYTSLHGARLCLKSGIPAHSACNGLLVTLRRPHDLASNDVLAFTQFANSYPPYENSLRPRPFEAVLALVLPKDFLYGAPGFETDPCLRFLPAEHLAACYPPFFSAVLESSPWDAGCLLLPPTSVVKSYQLVPSSCLASGPGPTGRLGRNAEAGVETAVEVTSPRERAALQALAQSMPLQSSDWEFASNSSESESKSMGSDNHGATLSPKHRTLAHKVSMRLFGGEKPRELEMSEPMMLPKPPEWILEDDEDGKPYPDLEAAAKRKASLMSKFKLASQKAGKATLSIASVTSAAKGTNVSKRRLQRTESVSQRIHSSFFRSEKVLDSVANHIFHDYAENAHGLEVPKTVSDFCKRMIQTRRRVYRMGPDFVCLYHFTQPSAVPLIAHGGLRMSSTGPGGDGGVYFSTLGPCSFGLGSAEHGSSNSLDNYEVALIKGCFGIDKMDEYQSQGKLSAVLVYALPAACLSAAPGDRENAVAVSQSTFHDLSLPDPNKDFFLSPAFVVGAFLVDVAKPIKFDPNAAATAKEEVAADRRSHLKVRAALHAHEKNTEGVDMATLAAGFAAGQGVGGYTEDLETEAQVITVSGRRSSRSVNDNAEDSTRLRGVKAAKAHQTPPAFVNATFNVAMMPEQIPTHELSEEGLGSMF